MSRIVGSDYGVMLSLLAPLVAWGLYGVAWFGLLPARRGGVVSREGAGFFLVIAVAATLVLVPLGLRQIATIRRVFADGLRTTGRITAVEFFKDRGRVEYSFQMGGARMIQAGAALHRTAAASRLRVGQQVELAVDPEKPSRAFIVDLYCG